MRTPTRAFLLLAALLWTAPTASSQDLGSCALAFDDGPSGSTASLVRTLVDAGMAVANHSYSHQHMTGWSYQQVYDDLEKAQRAIQDGGVFLMHEGYASTAGAIPALVADLRARGLEPGAIDAQARAVPWPTGTTDAWIRFDKVNLSGRSLLTLSLASETSGAFKVLIDGRDGEQIGTLNYSPTGSWDTYRSPSCTLSLNLNGGVHSVYLVAVHGRANLGTLTLE